MTGLHPMCALQKIMQWNTVASSSADDALSSGATDLSSLTDVISAEHGISLELCTNNDPVKSSYPHVAQVHVTGTVTGKPVEPVTAQQSRRCPCAWAMQDQKRATACCLVSQQREIVPDQRPPLCACSLQQDQQRVIFNTRRALEGASCQHTCCASEVTSHFNMAR
jgi:hypothetical protein